MKFLYRNFLKSQVFDGEFIGLQIDQIKKICPKRKDIY
jgi:hypothetical protein